jgi:nucleoside phosphorylase
MSFPSSWLRAVVAAAVSVSLCACGGEVNLSPPPRFAVLSSFPGEMAPVLARATVSDTMMANGHMFRIGEIGGVQVIIGLVGIGVVNAATTTRALLAQVEVTGIVVSAVAGSTVQIGDVLVPTAWELDTGTPYPAHPAWLALANEIAASVTLERCTAVAPNLSKDPVCMLTQPEIVVGGIGQTTDPYGGKPFPCHAGGGDVFGCDVTTKPSAADRDAAAIFAAPDSEAPIAVDQETAGIASEATAHGIPFIAFRAVSDGAGDPLGLPGYPTTFFAYYPLAARNAAIATAAFLQRVTATGD